MPYITKDRREAIRLGYAPQNPGELNYILTKAIVQYLQTKGESYQTFNDIVGALENAKLELQRRKIAPYEDKKIEQNGDVY